MSCIFCRIVAGEIPCHRVWEDEAFLAFLDVNPIKEGHILVIPKHHVEDVLDMADDSYAALFTRVKALSPVLRKAMGSRRVGIVVEGFGVPHVHVHLVPVMAGNELNPEHARPATPEALKAAQQKITGVIDEM